MVVLNCHQVIQCTMNRIILSGFNLDRQDTHGAAVINKEVNLSFLFIVVVEQLFVMCFQFLGNSAFIDRAKVNAGNVVQYWLDIVMIQLGSKHTDIVHVQLQQIFLLGFCQGIFRIADCVGCYRNTGIDQVLKLLHIIAESVSFPVLCIRHTSLSISGYSF